MEEIHNIDKIVDNTAREIPDIAKEVQEDMQKRRAELFGPRLRADTLLPDGTRLVDACDGEFNAPPNPAIAEFPDGLGDEL